MQRAGEIVLFIVCEAPELLECYRCSCRPCRSFAEGGIMKRMGMWQYNIVMVLYTTTKPFFALNEQRMQQEKNTSTVHIQ